MLSNTDILSCQIGLNRPKALEPNEAAGLTVLRDPTYIHRANREAAGKVKLRKYKYLVTVLQYMSHVCVL